MANSITIRATNSAALLAGSRGCVSVADEQKTESFHHATPARR